MDQILIHEWKNLHMACRVECQWVPAQHLSEEATLLPGTAPCRTICADHSCMLSSRGLKGVWAGPKSSANCGDPMVLGQTFGRPRPKKREHCPRVVSGDSICKEV
jgi:hypothetical protein